MRCVSLPAWGSVAIVWHAPRTASGERRGIALYDLGGRLVRHLPVGADSAGVALWDGRDQNGRLLPAGLYFARLISGSLRAQARVVLIP